MKHFKGFIMIVLFSAMAACAAKSGFTLSSLAIKGASEKGYFSALKSSGRIDPMYAAKDNEPLNPKSFPFTWKDVPKGTKVLALILDDPDAKPVMQSRGMKGDAFLHWAAADIDPASGGLAENASADKHTFVQGANSGGSNGYVGPRPPSDFPKDQKKPIIHIYRLTVYALSAPTGLKDGFKLDELEAAMKGKVLGKAELFFSYSN